MRIIFVLPSPGGGGGAHSVVQESLGLRRLGLDVAIATPRQVALRFRAQYPELEAKGVSNPLYGDVHELADILSRGDLAIATMALSVSTLIEARQLLKESAKNLKLGYYVQDYEPLFYSHGSPEWIAARRSFDLMKGGLMFAKTDWLCWMVDQNHNCTVERVKASIDHDIYYPRLRNADERVRTTAMVRPKSARRAPKRTIRVLEQIAHNMPKVDITFFGCEPEELASLGIRPSETLVNLGILSRHQVADTLRSADLFLDLSDYQAFGRTGLEGMACGSVPVLPLFGGAEEYAEHNVNSFVVDTRSDDRIMEAVDQFVNGGGRRRLQMRDAAIQTALNYSISKAAYSEYKLFRDFVCSNQPDR